MEDKGIEHGRMRDAQLFNLETDEKEEENVASKYPKVVEVLERRLNSLVTGTRGYERP